MFLRQQYNYIFEQPLCKVNDALKISPNKEDLKWSQVNIEDTQLT